MFPYRHPQPKALQHRASATLCQNMSLGGQGIRPSMKFVFVETPPYCRSFSATEAMPAGIFMCTQDFPSCFPVAVCKTMSVPFSAVWSFGDMGYATWWRRCPPQVGLQMLHLGLLAGGAQCFHIVSTFPPLGIGKLPELFLCHDPCNLQPIQVLWMC